MKCAFKLNYDYGEQKRIKNSTATALNNSVNRSNKGTNYYQPLHKHSKKKCTTKKNYLHFKLTFLEQLRLNHISHVYCLLWGMVFQEYRSIELKFISLILFTIISVVYPLNKQIMCNCLRQNLFLPSQYVIVSQMALLCYKI